MPVPGASPRGDGASYQKVDQAFYDEVKRENGGVLPPNLLDADGNPRKLTMSPADRAYRQEWKAIAAQMRQSSAVPNKAVTSACVPCAAKAAAAKIPPILLPSKKMGKPVKVATPAPAAASADPPAKEQKQAEIPCKHATLSVACNHPDRNFKLQLPAPDGASDTGATQLEVIDDGKEKVTCTTKILAGPCGDTHKGKVFDIYPDDSVESRSDSSLVFRANHDPSLQLYSFSQLFSPSEARNPQSFSIQTQTCQQEDSLSATVLVYPQLDWDFDISLGLSGQGSVKDQDVPTEDRSSELDFSGSVSVTVVGSKKEFGAEIKHDLNQALKFADLACQTAEFLWQTADDIGGVEVEFDYPALSFSGTWGWREIEGTAKCGYGCDWEIGFSPLVGASVEVDILSFLITKIPAVGQVIEQVRKSVENEAEIKVFFKVEGTVDGTFNYSKAAGEVGDASGQLGGKLEFTLEGLIKTKEYRWLGFHAGGEVKVGGHASFSGQLSAGADGDGAYYQGSLDFDGLSVYAVLAGGIGFTLGPPPDDDHYDAPDSGDDTGTSMQGQIDDSGVSGNIAYQNIWPLIAQRTLLGSDEKHYFLDGQQGD